jgi:hypothetical protein
LNHRQAGFQAALLAGVSHDSNRVFGNVGSDLIVFLLRGGSS